MNILFICGSAEPGKDGVGDYTRRLCGELIKLGHEAHILSLCDHQIPFFTLDYKEIEGTKVLANRIPQATSKKRRRIWSQNVLNDFEPDWISLQFVPYSFNPKGLPFWLPSFLKKLKGNHKWHIMFHELWLGIDKESSFRHKCIGKLQQLIVNKTVHNTKPQLINTQNKLYQFFLQSHEIAADILPICGNIPLTAIKDEAKKFTQFVLFGTIHPGAPFNDFIEDLESIKSKLNKPIKFIFVGNNGSELSKYINVLESNIIHYEVLGIQTESIISQILINSDYGISTTPYFQTEKSGVYAAYREHQLNTICVSRNWTPTKGQYEIPQIIKYEKNNLNIAQMDIEVYDLQFMAAQFINSLYKI
ncbi:MAG: glycosyltransferase [Flavobacterium sp.]|nr:glycosyltransferase [Flavobacterium sp.]